MSHPDTPTSPADPAYVPAHGGMCPIGPHLVCGDFNAMPQRMWRTDRQTWPCEGCGVRRGPHLHRPPLGGVRGNAPNY